MFFASSKTAKKSHIRKQKHHKEKNREHHFRETIFQAA